MNTVSALLKRSKITAARGLLAGEEPATRRMCSRWAVDQGTEPSLRRANYEILSESSDYYGTIPDFQGVWASASTLEGCRRELQEVLEDWILLALRRADPLPVVEGLDLNVRDVA